MDDSQIEFAKETGKSEPGKKRCWQILVVDDEKSVHEITMLILKELTFDGLGLEFINAYSAKEARKCLDTFPKIAMILLDVVMESETAGLELVRYVRNVLKNDVVQVVIRTGQPGHAPEEQVISEFGINSYLAKTEVTARKLVSQVTTALRSYRLALALEKKVEERTRELARANKMKSQFLANMSHEIRTPMNGIIGMANLLLDESLTPRQTELASIIRSSGDTLQGLINDILDLSKIEAGQISFEIRDFNLGALIQDSLALFSIPADEKGLDLDAKLDTDLPPVLAGDSLRIKQILVNLLGNAVKFTQKGRIMVRARLEQDLGERILLGIEVLDTGPGIEESFKDRLFETFSQQDASTTRKYGGTGLGLAITKQLALLMAGSVHAWNREGGGAVFKVILRLDKHSDVPVSRVENGLDQAEYGRLLDRISKTNARILVAEDNFVNQKVIRFLLEKMNIVPDIVGDGGAALEKLRKKRYDLMIMDVQMPVLDGLDATRTIRNETSDIPQKDIYIIALTAMATNEDALTCKKAGMNQVLTKPVHPQKLMQAIAQAMGV